MKSISRLLYIFLAIGSASVSHAQINTDQVIHIGRNALYFEDYVLSIQYFNQVIAAKPYLAQPYFYRALAKYNLDDLNGAEEDASIAIEHNPFIIDAYELRGVTRQNLGKFAEAIADYDHALTMLPENKGILYNRALAQEDMKDFDGARESFARLLDAHPSFDGGHLGRARLNMMTGDTIAALEDINKALEINRNAVNGYVMRADIAINSNKDYARALSDMNEAIRLQPRYAGYFINRAFLRYNLDDYFGAMSDYDYALELDPLNSMALYNRALLRAEVHDYNKAIEDLTKVLTLRPNDYRALYNRAVIYREIGEYNQAISDIDRVLEAFPDLAAAYFLRFDIKQSMGDRSAQRDYDRSLALAKQRIKRDGSNPSMAEVFGNGNNDDSESEPQEVVAARFSSLITIADNSSMEQEFNNKSIRGKVQDRNVNIEIEPIFVASYYTSPTELKPTGEYMRQVDEINNTHALNYMLQITNHEVTLTDPNEINKHFESIDYYNSYLSTHTPRAIDYFGRGMNQMTVHNYTAALADFEQAITTAPDFVLARFMISVARYKIMHTDIVQRQNVASADNVALSRARYQEVIDAIDRTIDLAPDLALAYYNKGVILIEMQDFTSAISALNKAIELKPDFGEAYYNRGYVYFRLGNRSAGNADLSKAGELGIVPSYNLLKRMSK